VKRSTPRALQHLDSALDDLDRNGLLRTRPAPVQSVARSFCSNDYLGLGARPAVPVASGSGASRLVVGEHSEHLALERDLAAWLRAEAALLFTSGYAANVGIVSALAAPGDLIVSDALNHASLIDGCRLSRAKTVVVPHLDLRACTAALRAPRAGRAWVVTESYFSMDADGPDLEELRRICDAEGAALVVDEAHALGVLGPEGRGRCAEVGVVPDVLVGTLGKSLGAAGAFAVGCTALVEWLWNRARSFVFSTGLSPAVAATARSNLALTLEQPALRDQVLANAQALRAGLRELGVVPLGHGPIVPVVVGDARAALGVAAALRPQGVHVQAIRPPTVPAGTARLRLTVTAAHSPEDIRNAIRAIAATTPWS
jgi:8-amino-7-oxononanoate synthase